MLNIVTTLNVGHCSLAVDRNKLKPAAPASAPVSSPASPPAPVACPRPAGTRASGQPGLPPPAGEKPLGIAHYRQQCEGKSQCIQQLRKLLLSGNRRLEALALVVQHVFAEVSPNVYLCLSISLYLVPSPTFV